MRPSSLFVSIALVSACSSSAGDDGTSTTADSSTDATGADDEAGPGPGSADDAGTDAGEGASDGAPVDDSGGTPPPGVEQLVGTVSTGACLSSPEGEGVTNLIDGDVQTKFLAFTSSAWAVFDAGAPYTLSHYALTSANDFPERDPVRWILQGSDDAVQWTDLDAQVDQHFTDRFERHEHAVAADAAHRWYRLRMENAGGGVVQIGELELFGTTVFVAPATTVPAAPAGLTTAPLTRTQLRLDWSDASTDEDVFRIERASDGGDFVAIGHAPADATSFTVRGIEPGAAASYRVVAENAAGASAPSEAIEAAGLPALVGTPGGGGMIYADAGYTLIVVDDDPGVTPTRTIDRIVEEFFTTYPAMAEAYNPGAPAEVTVQFDPSYDGVAEAGGDHIRISSTYAAGAPDDIDVIVHEGFHLVQAYSFGNVPGWATEGLADYVRWEFGTRNNGACWTMQRYEAGQSYTDAYGVTARFFLWIVTEVAPELALELDATLRAGSYDAGFWTERTGKTVDELWADYVADPGHAAVSYE